MGWRGRTRQVNLPCCSGTSGKRRVFLARGTVHRHIARSYRISSAASSPSPVFLCPSVTLILEVVVRVYLMLRDAVAVRRLTFIDTL